MKNVGAVEKERERESYTLKNKEKVMHNNDIRGILKNGSIFGIKKQESAITLIALVITIVVLLILAGVSINAVIGKNGIIDKANEAKYLTKLKEYEERITLIVASERTLKLTENKEERLINLVYNKLDEQEWVGLVEVKEQDDELEENEIKVITTDNYRIVAKIDDDGKVTFIEERN